MKRILVVYEPGRSGVAALNLARQLADHDNATVTVVGIAPGATSGSRCGSSALDYDDAVAAAVIKDIEQAGERLGEARVDVSCEILIEQDGHRLQEFAAAGAFDVVLLPARRRPLRAPSHPAAAQLRRTAGAEIRLVDPRTSQ